MFMVVDAKDSMLRPIAQNMRAKLEMYNSVLCGELSIFSQILNQSFGSDLLRASLP